MPNSDERTRYIADLRLLLDFLDAHPEVPINEYGLDIPCCVHEQDDDAGALVVETTAKSLGVEVEHGVHVTAEMAVGSARYRIFYIPHEQVRRHAALSSYYGQVEPDAEGVCHG